MRVSYTYRQKDTYKRTYFSFKTNVVNRDRKDKLDSRENLWKWDCYVFGFFYWCARILHFLLLSKFRKGDIKKCFFNHLLHICQLKQTPQCFLADKFNFFFFSLEAKISIVRLKSTVWDCVSFRDMSNNLIKKLGLKLFSYNCFQLKGTYTELFINSNTYLHDTEGCHTS